MNLPKTTPIPKPESTKNRNSFLPTLWKNCPRVLGSEVSPETTRLRISTTDSMLRSRSRAEARRKGNVIGEGSHPPSTVGFTVGWRSVASRCASSRLKISLTDMSREMVTSTIRRDKRFYVEVNFQH